MYHRELQRKREIMAQHGQTEAEIISKQLFINRKKKHACVSTYT